MSVTDFSDLQYQLTKLRIEQWVHQEVFSVQWWVLLFTLLFSWAIWWKLVDKKRIMEITLYGSIVMSLIIMLDTTGTELKIWGYGYQEVPLYNHLMAADVGALPVIYMLIYQYFTNWKRFIIVHIIASAIFSFVFEPLGVWMGIYNMYHWEYIYSFPIYILIAVFMKWLIEKLKNIEKTKVYR